jgi:hypothetical protein
MDIGLLWFDDSKDPLADKVRRAAQRYTQKHGHPPTVCHIHQNGDGDTPPAVDGIKIVQEPNILPHHFWVGVEEETQQRKEQKPQWIQPSLI